MFLFDFLFGFSSSKSRGRQTDKTGFSFKKGKGFFGRKGYLSREELRWKLIKDSGEIPGSGCFYTEDQRIRLEKELFGKEYGTYITQEEFKKRLVRLEKEKDAAQTEREKIEIDRRIRYLKKFLSF